MHKSSLYLIILFTSLCQPTFGQKKEKASASDKQYVIPFQLTDYNNLSVQAIVNKKDTVNLMFHTASSSVILTEEAIQKLTSVRFDRTDTVKSWGGGNNASRWSNNNTLQIGELEWKDLPIWEDKNSGQQTDGKFGINLFENKAVAIDFEKKTITLSTGLPNKVKKYTRLKLTTQNDMLFLEATCATGTGIYQNKFLVHSGYSGAILLDDEFVRANKIGDQLKIIGEKELKDSFGNIVKTRKAVLPEFIIGDEKLHDVPAGFFEGAIGRQKMSIIGGDLLKRFHIVIDAQRAYVYLKANSLKGSKYI